MRIIKFYKYHNLLLKKLGMSGTRLLKPPGATHPYHYHFPNTIHWHHLWYA